MTKVISLSELNQMYHMDINDFVQQKYGEGWYLDSDFSTLHGAIRIFENELGVKYTVEYRKNDAGVLQPHKLLRVCNVIVDMK